MFKITDLIVAKGENDPGDVMKSEFESWFSSEFPHSAEYFEITYFDVDQDRYVAQQTWNPTYIDASWVLTASYRAWKKQQSKVDGVQKRVEALIQKYKDEDRELKLIDEWEQSQIYGLVASELEQALKDDTHG